MNTMEQPKPRRPRTRKTSSPAPPTDPAVITTLRDTLASWQIPAGPVVVAVSGGADSVALLVAWSELAAEFRHDLYAAHFDHQLRDDSDLDADWVQRLAESLGITCLHGCAQGTLSGSEEQARRARYRFLAESAQAVRAPLVATAHTADDQAETVLMAIVRGTGLAGLAGMPPRRSLAPGVELVRPLLTAYRADIERYLQHRHLRPSVDPTNAETHYTRNWVRHEILPQLRARVNPRVDEALLRLAGMAGQAAALIGRLAADTLTAALVERSSTQATLALPALAEAEPLVLAEAFRLLWEQQRWPRQGMGHDEYLRLDRIVRRLGPRRIHLPGAIAAERRLKQAKVLVLGKIASSDNHE